jgi:CIC family chloride channel protein
MGFMQRLQLSQYFSDYRALLPYSLLGIIAGICSALAVLLFDNLIIVFSGLWLPGGEGEGFSGLSSWQRFALPATGALVLGLVFSRIAASDREVGIVHVLSRMRSHYGQLPLRNALVQLLGGAIALATGQSGGREGPGVHLGAAINSTIASRLNLPNNSQRILIACGTAGGIAAAFNTPLAGVIFAMEVIVAEYTVIGFTPVILAAVSATTVHHALDQGASIFAVPPVQMVSLLELPFILLLGICCGAIASLYIYLIKQNLRFGSYPVWIRFGCAGIITGTIAIFVPEVMGIGYDSLNSALLGELAPMLLLTIVLAKIVATSFTVGLGMPVGVIGPSLLIGGCLGGLLGFAGSTIFPALSSDTSLYVVMGMGAAMAAALNAPLAAILAVVELTRNVHVVFPTMLAIVAATLTTTIGFRQRSIHQTILRHLQRDIPEDPISQMLDQTAVLPVMDRDFALLPYLINSGELPAKLPRWCLLQRDGETLFLIQGSELQSRVEELDADTVLDLTDQNLRRWSCAMLTSRSNLREVLDTMRSEIVEAVLIREPTAPETEQYRGVITRDMIDQFYLKML